MLIATAGHVDHGKTLLVRALTGVDTDRLPEEKRRGLTIDLGFAYRTLDSGATLGFVDVPGHERFIRNMLAGVPAIDFGLLVVAADDGPMPQTIEHLAILDLLGVERGAVAITKSDRADETRVTAVEAETRQLIARTGLRGSPLFALSALTGAGIGALEAHLIDQAARDAANDDRNGFRLAVDRCFSVRGSGVVVTGAVFAGEVRVADRLRIGGRRTELRVRGIESAGASVARAGRGQRCALNVAGRGVDTDTLTRGDWLVAVHAGDPSARFDARLRLLDSEARALGHWAAVHVHVGAAFSPGWVSPLEDRTLSPGAEAFAQVVLERPTSVVYGDRFVIRDPSARRTLGGGRVIDPYAQRRVREKPARVALLRALDTERPEDALAAALDCASDGIELERFVHARNLSPERAAQLRGRVSLEEIDTSRARLALSRARASALRDAALERTARYHAEHPAVVGPRESELVAALLGLAPRPLLIGVLCALVRDARLVREGSALRLPSHAPTLSPEDRAHWQALASHLARDVLQPPTVGDLAKTLGQERDSLLAFLERSAHRGQLVRVAPNRFLHPGALARLAACAEQLAGEEPEGRFDARAFKNATGIGRNLAIQVLELFDVAGFTRRLGERRAIVRTAVDVFGATPAAGQDPAP